jgi:uncharacterized membrane protein YqgA involved in biofilm formation
MFATYFNCIAVIIGSLLGLLLRSRIRDEFKSVVMSSSGLVTLVIGMSMALGTNSYLILIFSVVIGGFVGYALHIEDGILRLGDWMDRRTSRVSSPASDNVHSEGGRGRFRRFEFRQGVPRRFVAVLLRGDVSVGSIQAGTVGDYELIMVKSIMDGCMAIIFAAAYGHGCHCVGPVYSHLPGFFTLAGGWLAPVLGDSGIAELSAVGGILLLMIGLGLTGIKEFKTGNFLPAMVVAPLLAWIAPYLSALMP